MHWRPILKAPNRKHFSMKKLNCIRLYKKIKESPKTHKNNRKLQTLHWHSCILTMVLNKSIKHQTFLKYDFQPHDMIFDMNSITITTINANSTIVDVIVGIVEELFT